MKVATLGLDSTVHSHFFTPKTSSGTSMCMSCFTGVWQDRRQPSRLAASEVGLLGGQHLAATALHHALALGAGTTAPQAEERKTFCAARVCSSLPPAGTVMVRSRLITMFTSPLDTSLARAARMITTSARTMAVNMPMARKISKLGMSSPYSWTPERT